MEDHHHRDVEKEYENENFRDMGLELSIGLGDNYVLKKNLKKRKRFANNFLDFSLPLHSKEEEMEFKYKSQGSSSNSVEDGEAYGKGYYNDIEKKSSNKKLRLTQEQTSMLEDSFKLRSTLNSMNQKSLASHIHTIVKVQKEALAQKLNLRPRQVEVWFQNRRARTKLKQTEIDCVLLKKQCESLSDENQRLKKELQELQSLKLQQQSFYIQLPKPEDASLAICASCNKIIKAGELEEENNDAKKRAAASTANLCGPP